MKQEVAALRAHRPIGGVLVVLGVALLLSACGGDRTATLEDEHSTRAANASPSWELVWADDFDGAALDASKWNRQLGDGTAEGIPGWGNNELQTYRAANVSVADGHLVIAARREDADGRRYTSGRINTAGKFAARYGRFEASIRMPAGRGLWGAFWMLPEHRRYGSWPASGEIDIMEVYSRQPPFAQGVAHYGMAWPLNVYAEGRLGDFDPADGFHTYALEWDALELRWFIDGTHYHTVPRTTYWSHYKSPATNAHVSGGESAPFDQPFHLLANLAVGGDLPGDLAEDALPATMLVDYVRVYRCNVDAVDGVGCAGLADPTDDAVAPTAASDVFSRGYDLYADALLPLALPDAEAPVSLAIDVSDGATELVDDGAGGRAIDLRASAGGRFSIVAEDASRYDFYGMGGAPAPLAGELQFDIFVFGAATALESSVRIGLASDSRGFAFVELPLDGWPQNQWATVTVQISDMTHGAGDATDGTDASALGDVHRLVVLEFAAVARIRLNEIKILCAHSQPGGCGIRPAQQ